MSCKAMGRTRFRGASPLKPVLGLVAGVLLFVVSPAAISQEGDNKPETAVPESSGQEALIQESLQRDIETSRIDELKAWCEILGLNSSGNIQQLRSLLAVHYGLVFSDTSVGTGSGTRIVIDSADRSEYLNLESGGDNDESVIRFSGNVIITVQESERNRSHRVEADSVVFNQSRNTITAVGNIRYVVDNGANQEAFSGDSLTFEVSDWSGVIFRGTSERTQKVDDRDVEFFFRGESITRTGPDILILENGTITSHDTDNPDYALKAKKIWITGPGEWGLLSATLYVGHVPLFYFPFYWKSGSTLIINPVIGIRTRAGYYIQTSTYILGRKKFDDGFSMMGFGDSSGQNYELVRDGLFLVRKPAAGVTAAETNTLKYILDVYTSLGAMTGLLGSFPKVGKNGSIDFYSAIAVSRSIDNTGNRYFNNGSSTSVYWNSSYIGKTSVPLRWGSFLDMKFGRWQVHADWYSDPYFLNDFNDRKENFDWLSFLLSEKESDVTAGENLAEMLWKVSGSYAVPLKNTAPWLQSFRMDNFRTELTWKTRENADVVASGSPDALYNPARTFFYPARLILPDMKWSLRGASPQWNISSLSEEDEAVEGNQSAEADFRDVGGNDNSRVDYIESFNTVYNNSLLKASMEYGLQSQFYIENETNNGNWDAPSKVDFSFKPARINTTHTGTLKYGIDFWDRLTGISAITSLSGYYQIHANTFGGSALISTATKLEDYQYSQFRWDNSFSAYLSPFQGLESLKESKLSYSFDGNIYAYRFDGSAASPSYQSQWMDGADDVRTHKLAADVNWAFNGFRVGVSAASNLPPLDQSHVLSGLASYSGYGWKASLGQQLKYQANQWSIQPFLLTAGWAGFDGKASFSQSLGYDIENSRLSSLDSSVKLWGFEARFIANYGTDYSWDGVNYLWNTAGQSFSPSTLKFSYGLDFNPKPFWKNRITTSTKLSTSWNINLRQPTDNVLTFKWTQKLMIYKFLDLKFSFSSSNRAMYLYFRGWRNQLSIAGDYNFFVDLAKSFNVFNPLDRKDSQFNMERLELALVHHLRNWDITLEYSGWPSLNESRTAYEWDSKFSLFLKWSPLPMFNQRTSLNAGVWKVDSFE